MEEELEKRGEQIKVSGDLSLERGARNLERIKTQEERKEKSKEEIEKERYEYIKILQKLYSAGVEDVTPIKNIIYIFDKRLENI